MIITKSFLQEQANKNNITEFYLKHGQILNENMNIAKRHDGKEEYDVFLSHSYLDKTRVMTLVKLFNDAGYSVYVDWIDDRQLNRSEVNSETALTLRQRMEMSKGLAYLATSNITYSKWCPWELGYFDGKKNGRCCILPVMDYASFKGQEYLGIYPYIDYEKVRNSDRYDFWVNSPKENKYVSLREWLNGKDPYSH